ncbi:unnamed protein product, partial [Amoebophrya sp. A25]
AGAVASSLFAHLGGTLLYGSTLFLALKGHAHINTQATRLAAPEYKKSKQDSAKSEI